MKPQDTDPASSEAMRKAMEELNKNTVTWIADNVAVEFMKQNKAAANVQTLNSDPPKQASDNTPRLGDLNTNAVKQPTTAPANSSPIEAPAGSRPSKPDATAAWRAPVGQRQPIQARRW